MRPAAAIAEPNDLPDLPLGWKWRTIDELAAAEPNSITDGPFGSKLKTEHYTPSGPRVIRLANIGDGTFVDARAHISEEHFSTLTRHRVFAGDIVIAALGETLPRACIVPKTLGPAIVKADCIRFKPRADLSRRYLNYALNWEGTRKRTAALVHGVGRPRLNSAEVKAILLPIAPPDEQRRIVAEIEKQFTRLDAGVAALRRIQANLKRYRAAVLKAACEGRLVPIEATLAGREDRAYETGEQLLRRITAGWKENRSGRTKREAARAPDTQTLPPLPEDWTYASVEAVGRVQLGRQRSPKDHRGKFMRPYLRVANVYEDRLELNDVKEMNFTPDEFKVFELLPNDILLNEGQSLEWVGRPALYRGEVPGACFQNTLVRFRPHPGLNPRFALAMFRAFMHDGRFQKIAKWTTNIAHLGAKRFAEMAFPLPPIAEQERIALEVERHLSIADALHTLAALNLERAASLRQSVLQRAFAGQLATSDAAGPTPATIQPMSSSEGLPPGRSRKRPSRRPLSPRGRRSKTTRRKVL